MSWKWVSPPEAESDHQVLELWRVVPHRRVLFSLGFCFDLLLTFEFCFEFSKTFSVAPQISSSPPASAACGP